MMNAHKHYRFLFCFFVMLPFTSFAHEGQDDRIKYWKEYYHPKLEVVRQDIPNIKIELKKIGSFFQLHSMIENFKITPDEDLKNNNTWNGYAKLFVFLFRYPFRFPFRFPFQLPFRFPPRFPFRFPFWFAF